MYFEEVESDMSAFHRIDDVYAMPAPRFINLAVRLFAYKGIIRALYEAEQHREQQEQLPASVRSRTPSRAGNRNVPSDAATLATDPAFAGQFETKVSADG